MKIGKNPTRQKCNYQMWSHPMRREDSHDDDDDDDDDGDEEEGRNVRSGTAKKPFQ